MAESSSARPQFLVDTDWVSTHLDDKDLRIFDCTILLTPTPEDPFKVETVQTVWQKGHLPNAGFLDLRDELSGPWRRSPLEFNLPSEEQFGQVMSQKGVNRSSIVVLYSAQHPMWATRVWWMLRAFGHDKAVVMDGGWDKWIAEGRPTSTEACHYPPTKFELSRRPTLFADKVEVQKALGAPESLLLNALSRKQHAGQGIHYGRPGRIPGSACVPISALVQRDLPTFQPIEVIRAAFDEVGMRYNQRVITYCGSGIAASCSAFALSMLGQENVAVYDGSLIEWSNDPSLPMENESDRSPKR